VATRTWNIDLSCCLKHSITAKRHAEEVLDRLYRGDYSSGLNVEARELFGELVHLNKHSHEIAVKSGGGELSNIFSVIADKSRELYQLVTSTQLMFPSASLVDKYEQIKAVRKVIVDLDTIIDVICKYGAEVEQEIGCERCYTEFSLMPTKNVENKVVDRIKSVRLEAYGGFGISKEYIYEEEKYSIGEMMLGTILGSVVGYLTVKYGVPKLKEIYGTTGTWIEVIGGALLALLSWFFRDRIPSWLGTTALSAGAILVTDGVIELAGGLVTPVTLAPPTVTPAPVTAAPTPPTSPAPVEKDHVRYVISTSS